MTSTPLSGLYDGFEGFRTPTDSQFAEAIKNWLVVLDTNVLLSLYGVHGTTLDDYIKVFEEIGDRLFIPHQVLDEFWRNRRTVIAENQGKHRERAKIKDAFGEIRTTFEKWYSRVVERGGAPPRERVKELDEAVEAVLGFIEAKEDEHPVTTPDTPTRDDPILQRLEPLLASRVGSPPSRDEHDRLVREGEARGKKRIPPGYLDSVKGGERSTGDFILWHQTMEHAKEVGRNVLFVTQDQKEDWWADRGTPSMRARPELVAELRQTAGRELLMVRNYSLLDLSEKHLGVKVSKGTLDEAMTIDEDNPWTPELAARYLIMLGERNPEHLAMILDAHVDADEDEFICLERGAVVELLGREEGARLSGLTRPFDTVLKTLVARTGMELPEVPMWPYYENGSMSHLMMDEQFAEVREDALDIAGDQAASLVAHLRPGATLRPT